MAQSPVREGEPRTTAPPSPWPRFLIWGSGLCLLLAAGCAHGPQREQRAPQRAPQGTTDDARAQADPSGASITSMAADAVARLRTLASAARTTSSTTGAAPANQSPLPLASLDASWATAPANHVERHAITLDAFLQSHPSNSQPAPAPAPDNPNRQPDQAPSPDRQPAQRLYASGRLKLLAGDTQAALRDWEAALAEDPGSLDLAARVGVLQVRAGKRSTGLETLRSAAENGLRDAEALRVLAREEARSGDSDRVLELLVRATADPALARDEVQRWLTWTDLGERLGEAEYLDASRQLLAKVSALDPQSFGSEAFRNQDFAELLRRRGALLLRAGDLAAMRAQWALASDSYRAALASGALDESSARLRLAAVSLRAGNSADAALQVVESLPPERLVQPWHEEVADALRADVAVGPLLARAVRMEGTLVSATASARRVELAARCVPPAHAAQLLEAAASGYAQQERLLARLLDATDARVQALETGKPAAQARVAARVQALVAVINRDPLAVVEAARALVRHGRDLNETLQVLASDQRPEARLLASALSHHLDQPARALAILDAPPPTELPALPPPLQAGFASARIAALLELGREPEAQAVAQNFATQDGIDPWLAAQVLVVARDHDAARNLVAGLLSPPSVEKSQPELTVEHLALAAHLEALAGRRKESVALLERAAAIDPDAEFIADARLSMLLPTRPNAAAPGTPTAPATPTTADEQQFAAIVRALRERDPASPLVRRLIARDFAQRNLWRQAQTEVASLMDDRGEPQELMDLLLLSWQRIGDKRVVDSGVQRLTNHLAARPDSPLLAKHLAQTLVLAGQGERANEILAQQYAKLPIDELARQREAILRDVLKRPDEAQDLMVARMAHRPKTLANQVEWAQILIRTGDLRGATDVMRQALGESKSAPTSEQAGMVASLLRLLKPETLAKAPPEQQSAALELLDVTKEKLSKAAPPDAGGGPGPAGLPLDIAALRVDLVCLVTPQDAGAILDAVETFALAAGGAGTSNPNVNAINRARQEALARVQQRLFALQDATPSLRLLEELDRRTNPPNPKLGAQWLLNTIVLGDADDNRRMITNWRDLEHLLQSLAQLQISPDWDQATMDEARGELAYLVAQAINAQSREATAAAIYKLCLQLSPRHPWASNNYGYMILERGGSLVEAARLIEQAHEQLPDEASIADSLGWVRYKQGQLEDVPLPDGAVRQGAVTILEQCAAMPIAQGNWEIQDHLADALWRRNRTPEDRQRAIAAWRDATALLRDEVTIIRASNQQSPRLSELLQRQQEVQAKLDAARDPTANPQDVPVAPMSIPETFTPLPDAVLPPRGQAPRPADILIP